MRYLLQGLLATSLIAALGGCGSQIDDLKSESIKSSIPTTDENGVVTGEVNPKVDTQLVASPSGALADASIIIPAGTLSISEPTKISMGEASDKTASMAADLGFNAALVTSSTSTTPLFVGATNGVSIATSGALMISLPLPVTPKTTSLKDSGTLALLYLIWKKDHFVAGLKPIAASDLKGIFVQTEVDGLGFYRLIYLPSVVEASFKEVSYAPGLKQADK